MRPLYRTRDWRVLEREIRGHFPNAAHWKTQALFALQDVQENRDALMTLVRDEDRFTVTEGTPADAHTRAGLAVGHARPAAREPHSNTIDALAPRPPPDMPGTAQAGARRGWSESDAGCR